MRTMTEPSSTTANAHKKNFKDIRYKERMERMRYQASVQHVDRGRVLRQNGDFSGALSEFLRAAEIDPGNETARQEIGRYAVAAAAAHSYRTRRRRSVAAAFAAKRRDEEHQRNRRRP